MTIRLVLAACIACSCSQWVCPVEVRAQLQGHGGSISLPCGSGFLGLSILVRLDEVAVVFSGTVVDLQRLHAAQVVTFDVDRVWKGDVTKRFVIYRPPGVPPSGWPEPFSLRARFIVVAHRLSAVERADLRVGVPPDSFGTGLCGNGSRPFSLAEKWNELRDLGPGREPQ
jgi:hypothetical protein